MKNFNIRFNKDLYMKIIGAREAAGLPINRVGLTLSDHPLLGKKIKKLANNEIFTIKQVVKNWYHGYYITLLADDINRSTVTIWWENISSTDEIILASIEENHKEWEMCSRQNI